MLYCRVHVVFCRRILKAVLESLFWASYFNSPFLQGDTVFLSGKALGAISHPLLQLSGVLCCQLEWGRCCPVTHTFSFTLCWAVRLVLVPNKAHWRCHWAWIFINGAGFLSPHISLHATLGDTSQWNICAFFFYYVQNGLVSIVSVFNVDHLISCWLINVAEFFLPIKDLGRSPHPDSVRTVKGGPKPSSVWSAVQSLALLRGWGHSLRRAEDQRTA